MTDKREVYQNTQRDPAELTPEQIERMCPSCKARHYVPPKDVAPNYSILNISRKQWFQLVRAAEAFDRAASNLDAEEGSSGAGDGETLYPARFFVDWLKTDCEGFRPGPTPEFDGVRGDVDWLPQASDGSRRSRGRAA